MARRYNDAGRRRALQHIEDARRLTAELGGSDEDVKRYFFSLGPEILQSILKAYEQKYGSAARLYAQQTLPAWRSGQVTMSGMVASRLFNLLPPRMPMATKYQLVENLWKHVGPRSQKTLRIGLDVDVEQVVDAVRGHIEGVVTAYKIPNDLENRFEWISSGDVHVKQELLNHLRQMEKVLIVEGARAQAPVMLQHLRSQEGQHTRRLAQMLKIGNHELELFIDRKASGITLMDPQWRKQTSGDLTWLWWLIGFIVLYFLLHK